MFDARSSRKLSQPGCEGFFLFDWSKDVEFKIDKQTRGVRIIGGDEAKQRRQLLNSLIRIAEENGFQEIILPSLEPSKIYSDKAGEEVLGQMYSFPDKKGRELCLRPEGTATVQLLADKHLKNARETKFWYFERCWRYERPQEGRYREFFQFGLEIINPSFDQTDNLVSLAERMVGLKTGKYNVARSVKRGLSYYTGEGFEISVPALGAQKQVVGGGSYKQGVGFAIGFDRLMLAR
jgi:histidyl-tRNA synthetase